MSRLGLDIGWRIALAALAWLFGVGWQLQQAQVWSLRADLGVLLAGVVLAGLGWRVQGMAPSPAIGRRRLAALLVCMALPGTAALWGASSTDLRAHARLAEALAPQLEGRDLLLTGVVAALPHQSAAGTRFVLEVEAARLLDDPARALAVPAQVPAQVALGWYVNERDAVAGDEAPIAVRAGERWRLPVRLKRPHGAMNPGGFDVELLWWEQGVRAQGSVRSARGVPAPERLDAHAGHPVERARQAIGEAIRLRVSDTRLAGVIAALVVGDQAAIEREDWDLFRNTGIAHLVSISGLHVTMFAWVAGAAVGWLWRRSPRLMLRLPAPMAGRWGGLIVATGYALLAGWGVPAVRTLLMLAASVLLRSLGLRWPWLLVLLLAAVVVTAFDPWALLQPGFWLSFAAVGLLLASEPAMPAERSPRAGWRGMVGGHLRSQVVAALGLAPLSLVFFQQLSVVGFAANLVAIPLVTLLITPLALLGVVLPPLWTLAALLVQGLVAFLGALAALPAAVWSVATAPAWAQLAGLAGALLALLPLPWRLRLPAGALLLPLLWPAVPRPEPGRFDAVVADVGQGTAVLVRTREHLLVYDTGPQYSLQSDAGQRVLVPLLRSRGEQRVDLLVLSHRDADHVGGAGSLMAALPVQRISSSLTDDHPLLAGRAHSRCDDGQSWQWDGVRFDMLHPAPEGHGAARKSNALSCVLRVVDAQGRSLLLTGDIEAPQEAALLRRHGAALASTLLVVPHHGSRTSSSAEFLDVVQPHTALVQAGYRSRFGHPAPDVMARYEARKIQVLRTDRCGAWLWHDGVAQCTRAVRQRYWHWREVDGEAPDGQAGADVAK